MVVSSGTDETMLKPRYRADQPEDGGTGPGMSSLHSCGIGLTWNAHRPARQRVGRSVPTGPSRTALAPAASTRGADLRCGAGRRLGQRVAFALAAGATVKSLPACRRRLGASGRGRRLRGWGRQALAWTLSRAQSAMKRMARSSPATVSPEAPESSQARKRARMRCSGPTKAP